MSMGIGVRLANSALRLGIVNPVVCAIRNVVVDSKSDKLNAVVTEFMKTATAEKDKWMSRKETQGFRTLFTKMGYPKQIPAGERLLKSFTERGFKNYGNIVDAYNMVSMESVSGIGMHDLDKCKTDLVIRRAQEGLSIVPQFKDKAEKVVKDDLVYGCEGEGGQFEVMAWLGKKDYDSGSHCLTDNTKNIMMVVLGNEETSEDFNKNVCQKTFELIKATCPDAELSYLPVTKESSATEEKKSDAAPVEKQMDQLTLSPAQQKKPKYATREKPKKPEGTSASASGKSGYRVPGSTSHGTVVLKD